MYYCILLLCWFFWSCEQAAPPPTDPPIVEPSTPAVPQATPAPASPNFQNSKGRFEVYFPAPPQRLVQQQQVDIGTVELVQYLYEGGPYQTWSVSYADYPADFFRLGSREQLVKGVYQRLLSELGARLQGTMEWDTTTQWTDLRFTATVPKKDWHLQYYIMLQGRRLYQVGLQSAGRPIAPQDSLDFFGSFGLWK